MNRQNIVHLLIIFIGMSLFSCSAAQSQSKKGKDDKYQEDLSSVRPSFEITDSVKSSNNNMPPVAPTSDITSELNSKLDTLAVRNSDAKYAQGYRILVYSGKSSAEVKSVRTKIYQIIPDADIYQEFKSPNQRVKVGNCIDRREAYSLHGKLKKEFPNAVIIPDQIIIKVK